MGNIFGRIKGGLRTYRDELYGSLALAGSATTGGLSAFLVYGATKVSEYELSKLGQLVKGGTMTTCISGSWGNSFCGSEYVPDRIISLAEATRNMVADYTLIGILVPVLAYVSLALGAEGLTRLRNKRGESH